MGNDSKPSKRGPPSGEGGWDEMLQVDGEDPDVSWTSRRLALEMGQGDQIIKMLGGKKLVSLTNRELDRYKVITELVEQLFARADAEGLALCLRPQSDDRGRHAELFAKLQRWAQEIR